MENALVLYPYWLESNGCWVFDDERTGLKEEAFVLGMSEMITRVTTKFAILDARNGFKLSFSASPFAGHQVHLNWAESDGADRDPHGGNWYEGEVLGETMRGWLCPALGRYFRDQAPDKLYIKSEPLPDGVDPIWRTDGGFKFVAR